MDFRGYDTLPQAVKEQIERLKKIWMKHLGDSLVGIYIHGSIALDCFIEENSDVDLLIISDRRIEREERLAIAKDILENDRKPSPLEMSAIRLEDMHPWKYPTPCQFHYSDYWTKHYKELLNGTIQESFIVDEDFGDEDIACHVKLTNQSGICIYGKPIAEVFPVVPEEDFWKSISNDIEDYDFHAYDARYFASNILILGRILSYKVEKRILSKYEGGVWMREHVAEQYRYIVDHALREWYRGEKGLEYNQEDMEELRKVLIKEIQE
ncbi:aminoglycoside adenylyltransferase domain-containing protein [Anaerosporobacter faecicola]|uniref:aminoglycoside adenylyltransferase domain-containing protein n=1 Tax=Anaerosporobacter faecicola TaxID=2718714 RepID=UPI00143B4B4A|nr:aminoglycoside adenylyltransferase domain-containing protein [Anaerosporobacter faecicola]